MKRFASFLTALAVVVLGVSLGHADLVPGVISDFQDGTTQGWTQAFNVSTVNLPNAGPLGAGDNALELSNGGGGFFAMFNESVGGIIDPNVSSITVDILRPAGLSDAELRLVLFGDNNGSPSDRWTSTDATLVSGNGLWDTYSFSILESDLTQVLDAGGSYADLLGGLNRIMFRYDPGTPSAGGVPLDGTVLFDNITARSAVPEPTSALICVLVMGTMASRRRR